MWYQVTYKETIMTHEAWKLIGGYDELQRLEMKREADEYCRREIQEEMDRDKCGYPDVAQSDTL
jgi:hypothetical protein